MQKKQEKQQFLSTEILNKGFDPEKFVDLLETKKPGQGTDVDNWTLAELTKYVAEFQAMEAPLEEEEPEISISQLAASSFRNSTRETCTVAN